MLAGASTRVGAVAIGRNEGERLMRCLASLKDRVAHVVYVDSASSDGSAAVARAAGAQVVELDLTVPFTAARARNAGFSALRATIPQIELVQFVDGDCEVALGWFEAGLAALDASPDVAVVCGRRRERFPQASFYNAMCDTEWNTPVGEAAACGGDALMRAGVVAAVGAFDERLMAGEEPEMCGRIRAAGHRVRRIDAEMTIHDAAMHRLRQWWLRGVRSGFGYAQVRDVTMRAPHSLYRREYASALVWGLAIPLLAVPLALIHPAVALLVPAVFALQLARIAVRRGAFALDSWRYGSLMLIAKFAEVRGILRYLASRRAAQSIIEYKSA